jgi:hypothetical protein
MLSLTHVPGVEEQLAGLKKLAKIPLAPTFSTVLESTENGVSLLVIPSLLALPILVFATVSLKLEASGLALIGPLSSEIPVLA